MTDDPCGAFVAFCPPTDAPPSGLRFAVKDMIAVAGMPQPAGIAARRDERAHADAPVVARVRAAGHTIVGVTHSDAAGFGTMTDVVANPHHETRAVGGSSGGSAAAVAAGLADVALGTDTGGSVRIPAAYCDLYAFKPTYGRVPADGVLPLSPTLDHVGVIAATASNLVKAARLILATNRPAERHPSLKIVASQEALDVSASDIAEPFARLADILGAQPLQSPVAYEALADASSRVICGEAYAVHADLWESEPNGFPPLAASGLDAGARLTAGDIAAARSELDAAARAWREALEPFDMLISPTLPMPPADRYCETVMVGHEEHPITNANIRLCQFANAAGLPVLVVPIGGQSIQFVGRANEDETLIHNALAIAERLESALS